MKKVLLTLLLLFIVIVKGISQNSIRFTQFYLNPQFYNPAFTGIEPFLDIKAGRKQNLGAYDYAPKTTFLSANTSFNASPAYRAKAFSLRISNPDRYEDLKNPSFYRFKHGIGGFYVNENQNAFTQQRIQISYAMHWALKNDLRISAALSPYLFSNRVDVGKINFETNPDPIYNDNAKISYSRLGVNMGLLLYSEQFYLGYSAADIFKTKPSVSEAASGDSTLIKEKISHRLMGGTIFRFSERFEVLPSLVITVTPSRPILFNINTKFKYEKKYWAGLSYQNSGVLSLVAGGIINDWLNIGYAYDHTIKGASNYVSGSHEIVVGIMLLNNNLNKQYFW